MSAQHGNSENGRDSACCSSGLGRRGQAADLFSSSSYGGLHSNEFPVLCIDIDGDVMTSGDIEDVFIGPVPLYPAGNPIMKPFVISACEMERRIRTLEKHMVLDLPVIYSSTDKDVLKDPMTLSMCDRPIKQAIHHLGNVLGQVPEEERLVLRDVCNYYSHLQKILGDPGVEESAFEDLFRSFCRLADVKLQTGGVYTRHMKVLNLDVSVSPSFRITTNRIMGMNQGPYLESTKVVAVVELKKFGQWAEPFRIHPSRRPNGYKLTADMRGDLMAKMIADLEMSRCHGSKSKPNGMPLCIIGVSVFATKICFSVLEFPVKQYNDLISASSSELVEAYRQAYRRRPADDQDASDQCERARLRVSECFDMTRMDDRAEILNMLYLLGNFVE